MSKLTWLSKDKLAQSPAKEMGGEFVLAGRGSFQISFTDLCSDASLENEAKPRLSLASQTFQGLFPSFLIGDDQIVTV